MGWKASIIVIDNKNEFNHLELLKDLGFKNVSESEDLTLEETINPEDGKIYFGEYNNCLIICTSELPLTFLGEELSEVEKILFKYFPNSEICSLNLHSVVNLWGFSIAKNNKKLRVAAGSADSGTMIYFGEPVKEELELLSKAKIDAEGNRLYYYEEDDEPYTEDCVGEDYVFEISSRYFGNRLDYADELLFETKFKGFQY